MKVSKTFWLVFWLLAGLIAGGLLASVCAGVPALSWLAYGNSISFSPAADLVVLKFSLNLSLQLNVAEVLCVLIAMFCYRHFDF